jgi:serine/threonine protein kinase
MSQTRIHRFETTRLLPRALAPPRPREATRRRQFAPLAPRLERGDRLGAFRIEREISSGGAARVYAAADTTTKRRVALKVLSAHLGQDPEGERRFEAEYRLASRVAHAGIVRVVSWGRDRGHHFYAMELLGGETAASLPRAEDGSDGEGQDFARLAMLFAPVARALEALHARGIVHRDVKPDNLLIDGGGSLLLADFGSALDALERDPLLERCLSGTLRYMSPEQFCPGADPYDPLQDIYSLGLVLYEAATGIPAVPRLPEKEVARWKLSRLPALPRALNPRLPLGLEAIIRRAMEPEPRLRHPAAGELARDLERYATLRRGSSR